MEIREHAERVLFATRLADKLAPCASPTDRAPGAPIAPPTAPGRPPELANRRRDAAKDRAGPAIPVRRSIPRARPARFRRPRDAGDRICSPSPCCASPTRPPAAGGRGPRRWPTSSATSRCTGAACGRSRREPRGGAGERLLLARAVRRGRSGAVLGRHRARVRGGQPRLLPALAGGLRRGGGRGDDGGPRSRLRGRDPPRPRRRWRPESGAAPGGGVLRCLRPLPRLPPDPRAGPRRDRGGLRRGRPAARGARSGLRRGPRGGRRGAGAAAPGADPRGGHRGRDRGPTRPSGAGPSRSGGPRPDRSAKQRRLHRRAPDPRVPGCPARRRAADSRASSPPPIPRAGRCPPKAPTARWARGPGAPPPPWRAASPRWASATIRGPRSCTTRAGPPSAPRPGSRGSICRGTRTTSASAAAIWTPWPAPWRAARPSSRPPTAPRGANRVRTEGALDDRARAFLANPRHWPVLVEPYLPARAEIAAHAVVEADRVRVLGIGRFGAVGGGFRGCVIGPAALGCDSQRARLPPRPRAHPRSDRPRPRRPRRSGGRGGAVARAARRDRRRRAHRRGSGRRAAHRPGLGPQPAPHHGPPRPPPRPPPRARDLGRLALPPRPGRRRSGRVRRPRRRVPPPSACRTARSPEAPCPPPTRASRGRSSPCCGSIAPTLRPCGGGGRCAMRSPRAMRCARRRRGSTSSAEERGREGKVESGPESRGVWALGTEVEAEVETETETETETEFGGRERARGNGQGATEARGAGSGPRRRRREAGDGRRRG